MKVNYILFCDVAPISRDGTPSFLGVFSGIKSAVVPFEMQRFTVVAEIVIEDDNKHQVRAALFNEDGSQITKSREIQVNNSSVGGENHGVVLTLSDFILKEVGVYKVSILIDGQEVGSSNFRFIKDVSA